MSADPELSGATGTVIHAYGVVPANAAVPLPNTGIGGAGVALLDAEPVAAVFSRLPASHYGEAAWHDHAEDPRWLAEVAMEHQAVLAAVITEADILPLRLPAMYADEAQLHEVLLAERHVFEAALVAVHEHVEWGVKLYLAGKSEPEAPPAHPATGREYLARRSTEKARRQLEREERQAQVVDAYATLAEVSRVSVINPPQDSALTGRPEQMLLNSAHLVFRPHKNIFFAAVEELSERLSPLGIVMEVSGPWPPYNFVELGVNDLKARP